MSQPEAKCNDICKALTAQLFETFIVEVEFSISTHNKLQNDELSALVFKIFKKYKVAFMYENGQFKRIKISKEHLQNFVKDLERAIHEDGKTKESCDVDEKDYSSMISNPGESSSSVPQGNNQRNIPRYEQQMEFEETDQTGVKKEANSMENINDPLLLESDDYFKDDRYSFRTPSGLHIHIRKGNIIFQKVEAIVNAANIHLKHGSGVARSIADAAGTGLRQECREYIDKNGTLDVGEPMHTGAGDLELPILYVIHVAGPTQTSFEGDLSDVVLQTFENVLEYANDVIKVHSVAIPAISSGAFGVDKLIVAQCCYQAVLNFDNKIKHGTITKRNLVDVCFVNIDEETTMIFENVFRSPQLQLQNTSSSVTSSESKIFGDNVPLHSGVETSAVTPELDGECAVHFSKGAQQVDESSNSIPTVADRRKRRDGAQSSTD